MRLLLSLACDEARARPDGKLDFTGVFWELSAPGFPAAQERMTAVFVMEWPRDVEGRVPLRADLVDDEERKVLTIQGHTDVTPRAADRPPAQTRLVMPLERVVFPHAGRYTFRLSAGDGDAVSAFSLFVSESAGDDADD